MPAGDKTGPAGAGPRTGRGLGACKTGPTSSAYYPGFPGWGRGYGRGRGWRFGFGPFVTNEVPKETAKAALQQEKAGLEATLENVNKQLDALSEEYTQEQPADKK